MQIQREHRKSKLCCSPLTPPWVIRLEVTRLSSLRRLPAAAPASGARHPPHCRCCAANPSRVRDTVPPISRRRAWLAAPVAEGEPALFLHDPGLWDKGGRPRAYSNAPYAVTRLSHFPGATAVVAAAEAAAAAAVAAAHPLLTHTLHKHHFVGEGEHGPRVHSPHPAHLAVAHDAPLCFAAAAALPAAVARSHLSFPRARRRE